VDTKITLLSKLYDIESGLEIVFSAGSMRAELDLCSEGGLAGKAGCRAPPRLRAAYHRRRPKREAVFLDLPATRSRLYLKRILPRKHSFSSQYYFRFSTRAISTEFETDQKYLVDFFCEMRTNIEIL
jgi:hypothetical protein